MRRLQIYDKRYDRDPEEPTTMVTTVAYVKRDGSETTKTFSSPDHGASLDLLESKGMVGVDLEDPFAEPEDESV
jgi:hypothetical protein